MVLFDEIKYYLVNFVSKIFMASCKTPKYKRKCNSEYIRILLTFDTFGHFITSTFALFNSYILF